MKLNQAIFPKEKSPLALLCIYACDLWTEFFPEVEASYIADMMQKIAIEDPEDVDFGLNKAIEKALKENAVIDKNCNPLCDLSNTGIVYGNHDSKSYALFQELLYLFPTEIEERNLLRGF